MRASLAIAILLAVGCTETEHPQVMPGLMIERTDQAMSFSDPKRCAECHPNHFEQWSMSNHAYAAKDPVFHAMVRLGQKQTKGKLGSFCIQCHSPAGLATGQTEVYLDEESGEYRQNTEDLDPAAAAGVSCDVCHCVTEVVEPFNARMVLTPDGTMRGTIADPAPNPAHASTFSPLHAKSELCSACHAVVNPKGALVEQTFGEWESSSAAAKGKQCQDCHMPEYIGAAASDGRQRTLHAHTFVGVDVSLLPREEFPGYQTMRNLAAALLRTAVDMTVAASDEGVVVTLKNQAGHAVPSGATAERQMWLEVIATDEEGKVVFESGTLDAGGDLRDGVEGHSLEPGSDPDLVFYGQQMVSSPDQDVECIPVAQGAVPPTEDAKPVHFPWQADWQCDYLLAPDATDTWRYSLEALPPGAYYVSVRLMFRTFPMYFLRKLEEEADLDPAVKFRVPTVEMAGAEVLYLRSH